MKIFWEKHKIAISIGSFGLIVAPMFFLAVSFGVKRIQARADLIQQRIMDNDLEKKKIEKIPEMEEANMEFEKNKAATETILSANSKVDFIEYVEALAGETDNRVEIKILNDNQDSAKTKESAKAVAKKTATPEKKSIEEQLSYKQYISMQLSLTGDYRSFLNFARKLENSKHYANIISLNLQKSLLDDAENPLKSQKTGSNDVFSPPSSPGPNSPETKEEAKFVLKSVLNIIVYME